MPTYEYRCKSCQKEFEVFQSIHDDALKTCEACGGEVQRLISKNVGISFKGDGFYINDKDKSSGSASS